MCLTVHQTDCNSTEVGVGEWEDWGDYGSCQASRDYGFQYRERECVVPDTCQEGDSQERQLCINFLCDRKL